MTIVEAFLDRALFGPWFSAESWAAWRAFLSALFALPLEGDALDIYRRHTGRTTPPTEPAKEGWVIVGRRGGKSRIAALVAVYLACFRDYRAVLAAGEVGTVAVVAADRKQARTIMRYVNGFLDAVPMLRELVESRTAESVTLTNRVVLEVHTANWRTLRGYTLIGAVCDEIAFWRSEDSANPDREILAGLRPSMATVPGSLLLCISSPYAHRGALYDAHRTHFGQDGDTTLVWQAPTAAMNPTVSAETIADAYVDDPTAARSEYGAEFRADLESFVDIDTLRACVVADRTELPPSATVAYVAACDAAGGAGRDSFTACIAHRTADAISIDRVIEIRPPFSPDQATAEIAAVLRAYRVARITGDRYAGEWVAERFRRHGISYRPAELTRSEAYLAALPMLTGRHVELPDDARLLAQFAQLERRTAASGRDSVDHPRGGHDDVSNAVALCIATIAKPQRVGGPAVRVGGIVSGGAIAVRSNVPDHRLPLPVFTKQPWTHGSTTPCPLPQHMRRSR
jgi:hypothetical protein